MLSIHRAFWGTSILVDIKNKGHIYSPVSYNSKVEKTNERALIYIKHLAAENGFLRQGASKVSSTIATTLEIVSNTYMEGLSRQSQTVSQEESFETLDSYSSLERATHR